MDQFGLRSGASVSHHESIEALRVRILVADHAGVSAAIPCGPSLHFEERLQILEEGHLLRVGHCVILDVLLVRFEIVQDVVLLSQLGVEEVRVALELVRQFLLRLADELALVVDSLEEGFVDLRLDVVVVVLALVLPIVVKYGLHILVELLLFLVQIHDDVLVVLLFLLPDLLDLLHLRSQLPQFLNLGCQLLLPVLDLGLDFEHSGGDLLEGLVLLVIEDFLLVGDALDLLLNV